MSRKKRLIENILSLTIIKGLEYVLAFVTFPYLVRTLQVNNYGLMVFAQNIIYYFFLLSDYGFNLVAPREIARHDTKKERGQIFADIYFSKIILLILCTVIFFILLIILKNFKQVEWRLYVVAYLIVIGNSLFPVWFFQGIQKMRYITIVNIIAKIFSVIGLFLFVKKPEDYILAAFYQAITPLIAAICSWIVIYREYPEVMVRPKFNGIKKIIVEGWPIFVSTLATNFYAANNTVILGVMTNSTTVGYFSGAKKIVDNIKQLLSPITQAIYPYISNKVTESHGAAIRFLRKIVYVLCGSNFMISLLVFTFADWIVNFLLGNGYEQSIILLRILSIVPFTASLSNVFGIQTMLTFGMQKVFSKILLTSVILNTLIILPLTYLYQDIGVCISITIVECFLAYIMWYVLRKNGINLFF